MSAEENFARIDMDALHALEPGMRELQRKRLPLTQRYIRLREVCDRAGAIVAPVTPCRRGCAHCCHQAVTVSRIEAEVIGRHIGRKPASGVCVELETAESVRAEIEATRSRYTGVRCTFLAEDDSCSIYDARPLACRTHHSLDDDAAACDIRGAAGAKVPSVNLRPLHALVAEQLNDWADIREWFP